MLESVEDGAGPRSADRAIGVFDSGIGGLSVLRHIRAHLPRENLIYVADSGHAPYGGKSEQEVIARSLAIAAFLRERGAKALVVACNTATAAAIKALRERYPQMPVVGVEPGLKPAAAQTRSGVVGVLATERTLASAKFALLHDKIATAGKVRFLLQPCSGLADRVEQGELRSPHTAALVERFVAPLVAQGADTLVLGCTHYPFVAPLIVRSAHAALQARGADGDRQVAIVDTGEAVARQLARLLDQADARNAAPGPASLQACTTGSRTALATAFAQLLKLRLEVAQIAVASPAH